MKGLLEGMFAAKKQADEKLLVEQARQMLNQQAMNMAQQQEKYHPGWNDPRREGEAIRGVVSEAMRLPSSEEAYEQLRQLIRISENLRTKVERTEKKVEQLSGFYHWVTEVHPELSAQYKAMRELYEAANPQSTEEKEA